VEKWGFLWLMFALKPPLLFLLWLVWYASKPPEEEEPQPGDDGGSKVRPHPPQLHPRGRPRGPHGDTAPLPAPARSRKVRARAADPDRPA
jgi:hypothetical protein